MYVHGQLQMVGEASVEDDDQDEDKNGIADVVAWRSLLANDGPQPNLNFDADADPGPNADPDPNPEDPNPSL